MAFLKANRRSELLDYPFAYSYPRNCCESVSIIFSHLLEEKYGLTDVKIVRGTKPQKYEHHFWVRTGGLLYDLTAHQFPQRQPILGVVQHSLFASFPEQRDLHEPDFVDREAVVALYRAGVLPF